MFWSTTQLGRAIRRKHPCQKPEERCCAAATAIDNDRFLVVGGHTDTILFDESCRVYDTRTRKWSKDWPDLNIGRRGHTCVTTNNKVYVIGGCGYKKGSLDSIEVLDLSESTPRWRILPQRLKHKRSCYAAATLEDPSKVIVVGGLNKNGDLASCEIVCLEQGQEGQTRTVPSLMTPRCELSLVAVENRFLVAVGGKCNRWEHLSLVEVLDLAAAPEEQRWRSLPSMRTARYGCTAFFLQGTTKLWLRAGAAPRT